MTVLGPVKGEDLGSVLMNEHLVCDASKRTKIPLAEMGECFGGSDNPAAGTITLENLAAVKGKPFSHVENMALSSMNEAMAELQDIKKRHATILDVTSVACGRDYRAGKKLSQELGVHVIVGTSCSPNKEEEDQPISAEMEDIEASKQDIEFMEQELLYGIEDSDGVCAGFIGEIEISDKFTSSELRELKAATVVQKLTNAPLIVAEATPEKHALQILDHIQACDGLIDRTIFSHMDMHANDISFLKQLLDRGAILCFDKFSVSSNCFDPDQIFPTVKQVVDCIYALVLINPKFVQQIVVSNGIFMKLQYRKYGGLGCYTVADYLLPRLLAKGLAQDQIDQIMCHNPRRMLQWWKPPPEKIKPKEYIPCSVCKKMFEPILGEYYTKYSFTYCDTDCLRVHRTLKFKALD